MHKYNKYSQKVPLEKCISTIFFYMVGDFCYYTIKLVFHDTYLFADTESKSSVTNNKHLH
jgi:hypothetical protein